MPPSMAARLQKRVEQSERIFGFDCFFFFFGSKNEQCLVQVLPSMAARLQNALRHRRQSVIESHRYEKCSVQLRVRICQPRCGQL